MPPSGKPSPSTVPPPSSEGQPLGTTLTADAFTFSHAPDSSRLISPQKVTGSFRRLANRLDLAQVRLHDLRHFDATRMLAQAFRCASRAAASAAPTPHDLGCLRPLRRRTDQDAAAVMGRLVRRSLAED